MIPLLVEESGMMTLGHFSFQAPDLHQYLLLEDVLAIPGPERGPESTKRRP